MGAIHTTLLITCSAATVATSARVRAAVYRQLAADRSFLAPEAIGATCDWFVIGGRASGQLSLKPYRQGVIVLDHPTALRDAFAQELALRADLLGTEEDAKLIDTFLYDAFLAQFEGQSTANDAYWDTPIFRDLDGEPVSPTFIGTKWLVVVDYHS